MSALTDLKALITGPDGSLRDRLTIERELAAAIAEESLRAQPVDDRLRQLAEWADAEADSLNVAFYSERACYREAAKKARALIGDEGLEIDVDVNVLAITFKQLTASMATKEEA